MAGKALRDCALLIFLGLILLSISLAADISSPVNLNGYGRYSIQNYANISNVPKINNVLYVQPGNATDFQAKVNLAPAFNACVLVPYSFYNFTTNGPLNLTNNTCIKCLNQPILWISGGKDIVYSMNLENITIEGCTFKSDYSAGSGRSYFYNTSYLIVRNNKYFDINTSAIETSGGVDPSKSHDQDFSYNYLNHTRYGIHTRGTHYSVSYNEIWYSEVDGIYIHSTTNSAEVNFNKIYNSTTRNGISVESAQNVTLTGNIIRDPAWYGIFGEDDFNTKAIGNVISGTGRTAIVARGTAVIEGNQLENNGGGILIETNDNCNDSIVSNNKITDTAADAIYVEECSHSVISGNMISTFSTATPGGYYGIFLGGATANTTQEDTAVYGNVVVDTGSTASLCLYSESGFAKNNRYENNILKCNWAYLLLGANETISEPFKNRPSNPLIFSNFDEGYGSMTYDSSPNKINGTNQNVSYVAGLFGQGLHMNGTADDNSWVNFPDNSAFTGTKATIMIWFKLDQIGITQTLVDKYRGGAGVREFKFYIDSNNRLVWYVHNNTLSHTVTSTGTVTTGKWYFVAARFTGGNDTDLGTMTIFLDNIEKKTSLHNLTNIHDGSRPMRLGNADGSDHLNGTIDEFYFYNDSLPDEEIQAHYYLGQTSQGNIYSVTLTNPPVECPSGSFMTKFEGNQSTCVSVSANLSGYNTTAQLDLRYYSISNPTNFTNLTNIAAAGYNKTSELNLIYYSILNPHNFINLTNISGAGYNTTAELDLRYYSISNPVGYLNASGVVSAVGNGTAINTTANILSLFTGSSAQPINITGKNLTLQCIIFDSGGSICSS